MEIKIKKWIVIFEILFVVCAFIYLLKLVKETKEAYLECAEKPIIQEVGYYKCAGTKKNPKYCVIPLKE